MSGSCCRHNGQKQPSSRMARPIPAYGSQTPQNGGSGGAIKVIGMMALIAILANKGKKKK